MKVMAKTASDALIEALVNWGVEVVFGRRGLGLNGLIPALQGLPDRIRFIEVHHAEAASLMACGYARFTGKAGVCLSGSGTGAVRLLNGLYDAKLDGQPVLAITGDLSQERINTFGQQDIPVDRLYMDVAAFDARVTSPEQIDYAVHQSFRAALSQRGIAHISFPSEVQVQPAVRGNTRIMAVQTASGIFAQRARLPYEGDLRQAAEYLNNGQRVAILAGRGALGAGTELEYVAGILGAPVIKALQGKAVLPDDRPFVTGSLGPLGTTPSRDALQKCDTLLMVGTSFPYPEYLPPPGTVRTVQIDNDAARIGLRYPIEVGLVGDSQRTLKELLPLLEQKQDRSFLMDIQQKIIDWQESINRQGCSQEGELTPEAISWELSKALPENAIFACDTGPVTRWWSQYVVSKGEQMHAISGNLAVSGSALPYAAAAQVAFPDRLCIAFTGDLELSTLLGEFATCARYQLPVKVILMNQEARGGLINYRMDDELALSAGKLAPASRIDFAAHARACGAAGFTVNQLSEICPALESAFAAPGPALIDFRLGNSG
jgi:pyruvate dehydrogenase (quinone)/pyruvate oxidase